MPKSDNGQFWLDLLQASSDLYSTEQEDDMKPLGDYLKPKFRCFDEFSLRAMKNSVEFLNLKKCYEKVQRRQDGVSTQRPMDCNIRMVATFDPTWGARDIDVYVQRHPDSAKVCGDLNGRVKLDVKIGEKGDNTTNFSVDLDSVYQKNQNTPIYKLSTVDPLRRNKFILVIRLTSTEFKRDQYFTSPTFLIRSRRPSRTTNVEANIPEEKELLIVEE